MDSQLSENNLELMKCVLHTVHMKSKISQYKSTFWEHELKRPCNKIVDVSTFRREISQITFKGFFLYFFLFSF